MRSPNFLNMSDLSSRTMVLGFSQPLTDMTTRRSFLDKERPARKADKLTAICDQIFVDNVRSSTSYSFIDLHGLLQE
jgi:hypothetical protein